MRQPFARAASLAAVLLVEGCVAVPTGTPPQPHACTRLLPVRPRPCCPRASHPSNSALIAPAQILIKIVKTKRPGLPRPAALDRVQQSKRGPFNTAPGIRKNRDGTEHLYV
ncbi:MULTISPECIES: hypothetical protein [unclassified Streptomyces]|uniref:hypothetical protein n=1 Tax=unclassified Streptomyces TaxID=2593676 RepID=UPI0036E4EC27